MVLHSNTTAPLGSLGFGLGLRSEHFQYILKNKPKVDWFEIISENYMDDCGKSLDMILEIRKNYPFVMHGVSLNIGSTDPINFEYLKKLKKLINIIKPQWVSDHLCWTGVNNINSHDLLPLPYTNTVINHVSERLKIVQDYLEQQILIENPSTYIKFKEDEVSEADCMKIISEKSNCLILLDINNIYVNSYNHKIDPIEYLNKIPANKVQQIHLAGHDNMGDHIIDTHANKIIDPVWDLYKKACEKYKNVSTMIERDDNIPEFLELYKELEIAKGIQQKSYAGFEKCSTLLIKIV